MSVNRRHGESKLQHGKVPNDESFVDNVFYLLQQMQHWRMILKSPLLQLQGWVEALRQYE